jgi:hypothetical protein
MVKKFAAVVPTLVCAKAEEQINIITNNLDTIFIKFPNSIILI